MTDKCNLCGTVVHGEPSQRQHQRSHGPDTWFTDCFGDNDGPIVHPLTGQPMTKGELDALRRSLRGSR